MSSVKQRRHALRKLLLTGKGTTQAELRDLLSARGIDTTQSTISRDLKLLGAQRRMRQDGDFVYTLDVANAASFPAEMIIGVEHNEALVVVRTRIGRAPAVGIEIDTLRHPDVLGTIAGDDTVIVIPRSIAKTTALARRLRELANLE